MSSGANQRIAKNAMFLYLRMGIVLIIKLYVTRILLEALGVNDYGIWNLLATFIISFQFISSPIVASTQRFLNYDMGKGGFKLKIIFNISIELILCVSLLLILGFETVGSWFVEKKMNFPVDRLSVVHTLYQLTIFSLIIQLIQKPFESVVIAHEKMSFYAFISIFDAFFLLIITYILKSDVSQNKLLWYGWLNAILYTSELSIYFFYCRNSFSCCRFNFTWDTQLTKEIAVFSGWNLFGGLSSMTANQGVNVLLNIFFGVIVNAAFGISTQMRGALNMLIINLQKAFDPQIVKSFSLGNIERMHTLVLVIMSTSYILALIVVFPMIYNMDFILKIWLGTNIPPYTYWFCGLTLIQMLFIAIGGPIDTAIFATGNIKTYQIWLSAEIFMNIIFCYLLFRLSFDPIWAFIVKLAVEILILFTRITYLKRIKMSMSVIIKRVFVPLSVITVVSVGCCLVTFDKIIILTGWTKLFSSSIIFFISLLLMCWYFLMSNQQRNVIKLKFHNVIGSRK